MAVEVLALAQPANFKVGAAPSVHPDPARIVAPRAAIDAIRIAALADQSDPAPRIRRAALASTIVGGARQHLHPAAARLPSSTAIPTATSADLEISPASLIHPHAA
jgi:hypothetical protein